MGENELSTFLQSPSRNTLRFDGADRHLLSPGSLSYPDTLPIKMHELAEVHYCKPGECQDPKQRILNVGAEPSQQKQELNHSDQNLSRSAFWDGLSKIWLTKSALRESHRRATSIIQASPLHQRLHTATDYIRSCQPEVIKDIQYFARHGGPDLSDIRNYPYPVHTFYPNSHHTRSPQRSIPMAPNDTSSGMIVGTQLDTHTSSMNAYSKNFSQHLIDHNVYPNRYLYPNGNEAHQDLNTRLSRPRPSLTLSQFSDNTFQRFAQADEYAVKKAQVHSRVLPFIEGRFDEYRCRAQDISFNNLDPLTNGSVKPAKSDIYYGARPEQLDPRIRSELNHYIVPATQNDLPLSPNFFLEAKGEDGSEAVVRRQARYDGALGARGIHFLRCYAQKKQEESFCDNDAHAITCTYNGGTLKIYRHFLMEPSNPTSRFDYHMSQVRSYAMTNDRETFCEGATAYRNARDWAKEQRDEAIRQANQAVMSKIPDARIISTSSLSIADRYDPQGVGNLHPAPMFTTEPQSNSKEPQKRPNTDPPPQARRKRCRRN